MRTHNGIIEDPASFDDRIGALRTSLKDLVGHVATRATSLRDATIGRREGRVTSVTKKFTATVREHPFATAGIALGVIGGTYLAIRLLRR